MGEGERCGSVTDLLQDSADLYIPPSPSFYLPPHRDCWGESSRISNNAKDKETATVHCNSTSTVYSKTARNTKDEGESQDEGVSILEEQTENFLYGSDRRKSTHSKAEAEARAAKAKSRQGIKTKQPKSGSGTKRGTAAPGRAKLGSKSSKVLEEGNTTVRRGKQQELAAGDDNAFLSPPKYQHATMAGCSSAYQQAVRAVRGASPEGGVVVLGPTGEQSSAPTISQQPNTHSNKFTFAVAIAATKMKSLGLRRSLGVSSATIHEEADANSPSLTPSSLQSIKKSNRQRPGRKKVFEDAYVITWSQPVLHPDQAEFRITFDKPKKARLLRVRQTRRRSSGLDVIVPSPEPEENYSLAEEWMEWRKTNDQVEQWLRANAQTEPDESHVVAMLLDPDPKKGAFYRV